MVPSGCQGGLSTGSSTESSISHGPEFGSGNSILVETGSQLSKWRMGLMFAHSHQDPSCRVLDVLEPLQAPTGDPDEKCITIVQSGGDKAWTSFSASERERMGRSLETFRR